MTSHQLFFFAKADIPSVSFCFATTDEYKQEVVLLRSLRRRFWSPLTVAGTHKLHCICSISTEQVEVKKFSVTNPKLNMFINHSLLMFYSLSILTIQQWNLQTWRVTKYDGHWWLGCVMLTFPEQNEVEINFLRPHGVTRFYHYLRSSDLLRIPCVDVLTAGLQPKTRTGRAYALNAHEMQAATKELGRQNI